ncbi:MAG TPA: hypothetical protein VF733_00020 [Candidatus Saccharimonadales bacterium]
MDGYIDERPEYGQLPDDMQQFLCRLIGEVSLLSDADAEAAMVAYDPNLDLRYFRENAPSIMTKDGVWSDDGREDLRIELADTRLEHELPMFLPHYAEGDYTRTEQYGLAMVMTSHVLMRCFYAIEADLR